MSSDRQSRCYSLHETTLQVSCSTAMSAWLDDRFRLLPRQRRSTEAVFFEFHNAPNPSQHAIEKPQGDARPFYEMPRGEACYFEETDEVYLSMGDGVRALYEPALNRVSLSTVESECKNLFAASHLVLTILLVEVFKRRAWYSLHAAGLSENGQAILIAGTSGAGKSTLSVALLRSNFDLLGEDMVFLRRGADGLAVRGLLEDVDASDQTIRFFSELHFLLQSPRSDGFPKRQVPIDQVYGARAATESRPRVIVLPHISGKQSSVLTQIESDQALLEIVPNVLLTQPRACQNHLGVLADLVKQATCYRLDTGRDFDRIPALFHEILYSNHEKVFA